MRFIKLAHCFLFGHRVRIGFLGYAFWAECERCDKVLSDKYRMDEEWDR